MFDAKKSRYLDDEEYKGIKDLEHLFEEINEHDDDYYKPVLVGSFKKKALNYMRVEGIRTKHYQWNNILIRLCHI